MTQETLRPYPDKLSQEEKKSILSEAEELWSALEGNELGGFSNRNRPFYIVYAFKQAIEKYGRRDVGLTWSKNQLDDARSSLKPQMWVADEKIISTIAHEITDAVARVCCHKTDGPSNDPEYGCRDIAKRLLEVFPTIASVISRPTTPRDQVRGWQSMDTAPTNGERVDIWLEPHDALESGNAHRRTNAYFKDGDWWFLANDGKADVAASYSWKVTAWMPVPVGPASCNFPK